MTIAHQLGLRLFIEGVEVPVIGASITIAPGAPAAAAIQIIATDKALELYPRTMVHLFFYDFVAASAYTSGTVTLEQTAEDLFNQNYRLLFMGELHGIQFSKDTVSRAINLQCVDFSNYWDTTYQYNFNGELLGGRAKANFIGANSDLFTSPLGHGVGTVAALLCAKCVSFKNLEGLLAGVVRILEAIGGAYYGEKTFKGCNDFCSIAELRIKLLQQICAAEKDTSTKELFARKAFNMWMNREVGSLGQLVTFRGLTGVLMKFIMHECYPNPSALFIPGKDITKSKAYLAELSKDPRTASLYNTAKAMLKVAKSAKGSLIDILTGGMVQSNVTSSTKSLENDLIQLRKYSSTLSVSNATKSISGLNVIVSVITTDVKNVDKILLFTGSQQVNVSRVSQKEYNESAQKSLSNIISNLETLLGLKTKHVKEVTVSQPSRLNNQIFRPDIWFAAPPMCNVLFPELYSQFQWTRNYLREISRMEMQTTNEVLGDDALFNGRYFAPNIEDVRKAAKFSTKAYAKTILPHELFTGIIPMFEKLSEANIFAMQGKKEVVSKGEKVPYVQRAVNYQYFKHRFASRAMGAMGRFNPWFVAGFPAVLIDKPMTYDTLVVSGLSVQEQLGYLDVVVDETKGMPTRAELLAELVPTQYQGMCAQLTHVLNQQGGSTQYAFTEARIHRESSEFLGVDKAVVSKVVGTVSRKGTYAVPDTYTPTVKSRGPHGGTLTAVKDVTTANAGRLLPLITTGAKVMVGSKIGSGLRLADDPSTLYQQSYGPYGQGTSGTKSEIARRKEMGDQSTFQKTYGPYGDSTTKLTSGVYRAYQLTESYSKRIRNTVDLPIEEAVKPPWIWSGWHNLLIGETYMQFFGTNAIVDVEKFTAADIVDQIAGADSYAAETEAQEGVAQGSKKAESGESTDTLTDRISGATDGSTKTTVRGGKISKKTSTTPTTESASTGMTISADRKAQGLAMITMEKERYTEAAIDYLVRLYSLIKLNSLDVETFLRNYTWRPIATLPEILGTSDLVLSADSSGIVTATAGEEGFHSRAFSDESNLFGLVDAKVTSVLGLSKQNQGVAAKLDVRGLRRQQVRDYVNELTNSKGLLG